MPEIVWTSYESAVDYLTTELNSLADDGNKLGGDIDNTSDLDLYMDIEVYLNTVNLSGQTNPSVYIYMLQSVDGTNYADGDDSTDPPNPPCAILPLRTSNSTHRVVFRKVEIPPAHFKLLVENKAGAAWNATGNTVKYRKYSVETN